MSELSHEHTGMVAWFTRNKVAATLTMVMIMGWGLLSMARTRVEVFPEISAGKIIVTVPYPGATPSDVEKGICLRVEEAIDGIEGVKRIYSRASEGVGVVTADLETFANEQEVLDDVKAAVDRITTFPVEAEKPVIVRIKNIKDVISVVMFGDVPEQSLKEAAIRVRDELTAMPNISQATVRAVRKYEVSIEVSEHALRKHGLSFQKVADAVKSGSVDLPGGSVRTEGGEILVRTMGQKDAGREFEEIVIFKRQDGTALKVRDIGVVRDGFEEDEVNSLFDGKPAVMINVFRVGEQGALDIGDSVRQYVDDIRPALPPGIEIRTWKDSSPFLQGRIDLLVRNAGFGLAMVFIALVLFMDVKLAFWTMIGIPISFLGSFIVMPIFDVSINMVSLFAYIIVLGIVVDDAIVVGEHVYTLRQKGVGPLESAIRGAKEMALPVFLSVFTTILAFVPALFVTGDMGKIMRVIPIVVITVLAISLIEALTLMPAHLASKQGVPSRGPITWARLGASKVMDAFVKYPYAWLMKHAMSWRYATAAVFVALFMLAIGYVMGGFVRFEYMPHIDADNVVAELVMPQGTPIESTRKLVRRIEEAGVAAAEEIRVTRGVDIVKGGPIIRHTSTTIGQTPFATEVENQSTPDAPNPAIAEVNLEIMQSEEEARTFSSQEFAELWRGKIGDLPGISSLKFRSSYFPLSAVDVELSHEDFDQLLLAAERVKEELRRYKGVTEIASTFRPGKEELKLDLKEQGKTLGLTLSDLATQVRQGFYGHEVQRIQRDREDVKVMVRYPREERRSLADIQNMRIRLPDGGEIPFSEVALVSQGRSYASIHRADRKRVINVTAELDKAITSGEINAHIEGGVMPTIVRDIPGLKFALEGEAREQRESMASLQDNFIVGMFAIYGILAGLFRSYIQPFIIMAAIPLGFVGALIGHKVMGLDLTIISGFGFVALAGVVVNDSLVLIDHINKQRRDTDRPVWDIVMNSGGDRFRAILLTTLTTFGGLASMVWERSLQAKFLVPMAVTLAFGIIFATLITLVLVPSLYMITEDIARLLGFGEDRYRRAAPETSNPS